ncbi:MAG TPA: trypsin-like serine protease [Kofleriaceae bacterium]|nr:trypsin-like serine protease [Kofleriaceae bacterium]
MSCGDTLRIVCSGTLIAPRVVLTAAHCVSALPVADAMIYFGADVHDGLGELIPVDHVVAHPDYAGSTDDVGLIILTRAASVTPVAMRATALADAEVGETVRVVGFGEDGVGGLGTKREGTSTIATIHAHDFIADAAPATSCNGDSGGPVFATSGATEEVAGVTAFGDIQCSQTGTNMRVDAYRTSFIDPEVAAAEDSVPPARPPLDPSVDFCAAACTADAECPSGMGCVTNPAGGKACGFRGTPPGTFTGTCGAGGDCATGLCMALDTGCLCYTPCAPPKPPGDDDGCSVAPVRDARGALVCFALIGAALVSACRARRPSRRRHLHDRTS